ncbi:hypothetical protein [Xanthomonas hortorum]|uniref:Uncharacterized protein n=1 Tax=Xanthomonas hortorum pv. carotae TaxID=487904 RepID=A0A6V7DL65_9XANT|nr:hypothetical protein [Xanthomonas hortorum]CAD0336501.1 hypothetical protein CFBP7900_22550 [Xanthomonas hortorum pv. carotae]CAD0336508.1 hypothetical protein CFBP7900_22550 [Xanthomonas hortorum pv. carotae]
MSSQITPILQVGAIGNPNVSDGRLLPYLTVDCTNCPDVENVIEFHRDAPIPGDVVSTWCWKRFNKSNVYLRLDFKRPISTTTHLVIPVSTKGYVVDWIMAVRGLYLQSSKHGNCASEGLGNPAIVVEVPSASTFPVWPNIYRKSLIKRFKGGGLRGMALDNAIEDYKARQREIWFRRPQNPSASSQ